MDNVKYIKQFLIENSDPIATVNQRSDYFTTLVVYLADDNSVFREQRSIGPDQKQIDAMKDIIKFFKNVCQNMWHTDKAVATGYMDKNGFINRDSIDVDIF